MSIIDVHFHVVPARFIAAIRRGELAEAVTITSREGVEHFDFHAPPGVPVEPDTALQPEMYDEACILAALDARGLDAAAISPGRKPSCPGRRLGLASISPPP
jgi:hypothetical protein